MTKITGRIDVPKNPKNPSVADVLEAFAGAYDEGTKPKTVRFESGDSQLGQVDLQVTSLAYESGSRGMFIIGGLLRVGGYVSVKVNPDTNQEERNKPGGKLVGYQESLELQLSRPSTKDIRTPHFEGHLVDISNHASSIGPGGRMCRTRLLWTYYRDAQGQRRQRTVWDWDWSTVWLLHRIMEDAKFSPQVRRHLREAGFHLKVVESGTTDNAAYSTTLGMRADQAVTWRELGRRIRNNAAVMKMLRDCLVIQECPHLRGPYLEQLNALAAEQP
jgi:hypothetical protein